MIRKYKCTRIDYPANTAREFSALEICRTTRQVCYSHDCNYASVISDGHASTRPLVSADEEEFRAARVRTCLVNLAKRFAPVLRCAEEDDIVYRSRSGRNEEGPSR